MLGRPFKSTSRRGREEALPHGEVRRRVDLHHHTRADYRPGRRPWPGLRQPGALRGRAASSSGHRPSLDQGLVTCTLFTLLALVRHAHAVGPVEQPQSGGPPATRPASTPAAQPTPARTEMAPISQFLVQAPHSMHAPRSARTARLFSIANTAWGHTCVQSPQPLQRAASSMSVIAFSRYLIPFLCTGRLPTARSQ